MGRCYETGIRVIREIRGSKKMTINTKFELTQEVYIPQLKVTGRVKAFYQTTHGGLQYNVRYFTADRSLTEAYVFEDELTDDIPAEKHSGFAKDRS